MRADRNFWVFLLLNCITCGIYSLFFWSGAARDVNVMCARDGRQTMNYWLALLLGIVTGGIFMIIWTYMLVDRVYNAGARYRCKTECSAGTYLLWSLLGSLLCGVGPFVAVYKQIQDLNAVATAYNAAGQAM